jgi:competence protein ComFB
MKKYHLKNYMEEVVSEILEEIIGELQCCKCEQCKLDIIALALNNLPPRYVVTQKGEVYAKISGLRQQFEVDAITAITNAANTIAKNPRHEVK